MEGEDRTAVLETGLSHLPRASPMALVVPISLCCLNVLLQVASPLAFGAQMHLGHSINAGAAATLQPRVLCGAHLLAWCVRCGVCRATWCAKCCCRQVLVCQRLCVLAVCEKNSRHRATTIRVYSWSWAASSYLFFTILACWQQL